MTDFSGQSIGRYHIIEKLGEGGMAAVYKAYDSRLEREVAIKLIRMEIFGKAVAEQMLKRFEREGKSLAKMMHPNIVPIHDYGDHEGSPYLVMAYIPGGTLKGMLGKAMPYPQAARLLAPVAHALAYAHGLNIIHRDVKPANILITSSGQPMLSDFGVAKILESEEGNTLTGTGVGIGTPEYMAPEQWVNKVVPQTDIYALGVVFYELVTGRKPYTADTPAAILIKQVNDPLPRPKEYVPELPDEVERVIFKAMAKEPEERYASIEDMAVALERLALGEGIPPQEKADRTTTVTFTELKRDKTKHETAQQEPQTAPGKDQTQRAVERRRRGIPGWVYPVGGLIMLGLVAAVVGMAIVLSKGSGQQAEQIEYGETSAAAVLQVTKTLGINHGAAPTEAPEANLKVCQVTDVGGIDDKTFNQTAWKGVQDAMAELGAEGKYLESQQQTDYEKNLNTFIEEGCDLIVPVGFLLGEATQKAAEANPDQKFAIVDFAYDPPLSNVLGLVFSVDQPSFMAGYLAAGMSQTGKVGTYGGIQIPVLVPFMTGFYNGAMYYNKMKGANVEVLGWDPATETGLFTGNFESLDDGRRMAETLMDEGADVIYPVAGPVGLGSAAVIQERGNAMMIGVDTDMTVSAPEYTDILLTSVLKNMDKAVFDASQMVLDGKFEGGLYVGTSSNGGVGLAPYHDFEGKVPADLKTEVEQIGKDIASGSLDPMAEVK